jgi:RHS repeat-associated protein
VSGLGWNVARTTYPPTLDSGFTVSTSSNFVSGNNYGCSIGYLAQATSSAINPTWNLGSAQSNAARIATFRPLVTQGSGGTGTGSTTVRYIANDNLSGSNIVLDASSSVVESLDYFPYGGLRADTKTNYGGVRNKYAGTVYDALSNLNYMQARYQNSSRGQFLSEDPTFLAIGTPKLTEIENRINGGTKLDDRQALQQFLSDPQLMNSYGYGRDNPIINKDSTGEIIPLVAILAVYGVAQLAVDSYDAYNMNIKYSDVTTPQQKGQSTFKAGFDLFTMGVGGAAAKVGLEGYDFALSGLQATGDTLDYFFGRQIYQNMNYNQVQSQTSAQSRQQYAQNYNASFGLSTGGGGKAPSSNSLWVTPSGAVVTFGGQLVAGPTNKRILMAIFLILAGTVSFIYGLLNILGLTKTDVSRDSDMDKKLMSKCPTHNDCI